MCNGTLVAIRPVEREPHSFYSLRERLISVMYRLQLAADNFGDLTDVSQKNVPGAYVVAEVPRELENLYDDFGEWYEAYEHSPKLPKAAQS
ncbi:MAG: hypothetical protein M3495_00065 [Pseudomonadota bacterium]|nr:hypothetical protein [Gammaproteobacteria bacterium]MDQ3580107.1 hypothetical protein [Pseudomonadota bacterium]